MPAKEEVDKVTSSSFSPRSCRIQGARPHCWCPARPPPVHSVLATLPSSTSLPSTEDWQRLQQPLHQMKTVQQQESLERHNSPPGKTERRVWVRDTRWVSTSTLKTALVPKVTISGRNSPTIKEPPEPSLPVFLEFGIYCVC